MLPAIARHAIERYTAPDDLVIDPMCGIGTTLVEAIHAGRDAIGVEYEQRWANLALANIDHAADQGATGGATAICGDGRRIDELVSSDVHGRAALVLTSPPYGDPVHGQVRTTRDSGRPNVEKFDHRYSRDPSNLAHRSLDDLMAGFTKILIGCRKRSSPTGSWRSRRVPSVSMGRSSTSPRWLWRQQSAPGSPHGSAASRCWHASGTTG